MNLTKKLLIGFGAMVALVLPDERGSAGGGAGS